LKRRGAPVCWKIPCKRNRQCAREGSASATGGLSASAGGRDRPRFCAAAQLPDQADRRGLGDGHGPELGTPAEGARDPAARRHPELPDESVPGRAVDAGTLRLPVHGRGRTQRNELRNLFIAALAQITGSFDRAVKEAGRILAIEGRVLASTLDRTNICAELADGTVVEEELEVPAPRKGAHPPRLPAEPARPQHRGGRRGDPGGGPHRAGSGRPLHKPDLQPADPDVREAVRRSPAKVVYVCSLATQPGQTDGMTGLQHVREIVRYLGRGVLDYVVINTGEPPPAVLRRTRRRGSASCA